MLKKVEQIQINILTLPITGITVNGVIPNQTINIHKQVSIRINIMGRSEKITYLIVDGLQEAEILGTDFLDRHKSKIIYED